MSKESGGLAASAMEMIGLLKRELSAEDYLKLLSEEDRENVQDFANFIQSLSKSKPDQFQDIRLGVIAVGSTVQPEDKRHHPPKDIDLRVLHTTPSDHKLRRNNTVDLTKAAVRDYLERKGLNFEERDSTTHTDMVKAQSIDIETHTNQEILANRDPSFRTSNHKGIPLHIIISGADTYDLEKHLGKERQERTYFSLIALTSWFSSY